LALDNKSTEIDIDTEGNLRKAAEEAARAKAEAIAKEAAKQQEEIGGHHLLSTPPAGSLPFSAAADDWADKNSNAPDPLAETSETPTGETLNHTKTIAPPTEAPFNLIDASVPPPEEQARTAVEQAYQNVDNPAAAVAEVMAKPESVSPTEVKADIPKDTLDLPPPVKKETAPNSKDSPAPPPFPPPITLNQGVVIPPPYTPSASDEAGK
jgi:hypothetical protein